MSRPGRWLPESAPTHYTAPSRFLPGTDHPLKAGPGLISLPACIPSSLWPTLHFMKQTASQSRPPYSHPISSLVAPVVSNTTPAPGEVTLVALQLPPAVFASLQSQASALRTTVHSLVSDRLSRCASHDAVRPLYLDDAERGRAEGLVGKQLKTTDDLLSTLELAMTLDIAGTEVKLPLNVLSRLQSRAVGKPLKEYIASVVVEELERHVGLR